MASYFGQGRQPKVGDQVWVLDRPNLMKPSVPRKGVIALVSNIDTKGLANVYVDVRVGKRLLHVSISQIFDHKPVLTQHEDSFGNIQTWE